MNGWSREHTTIAAPSIRIVRALVVYLLPKDIAMLNILSMVIVLLRL